MSVKYEVPGFWALVNRPKARAKKPVPATCSAGHKHRDARWAAACEASAKARGERR